MIIINITSYHSVSSLHSNYDSKTRKCIVAHTNNVHIIISDFLFTYGHTTCISGPSKKKS